MSNLTPIKSDSASFMHVMPESQKQAMDEQMQKLKSEKETLQKRVSEQGKQITSLSSENSDLRSENVTLQGRVSELETMNASKDVQIADLQGRVTKQDEIIGSLKSNMIGMQQQFEKMFKELQAQRNKDLSDKDKQRKADLLQLRTDIQKQHKIDMLGLRSTIKENYQKSQEALKSAKNKNAQIKAQLLNSFIQKRQRSILRKAFSALRNNAAQSLKKENAELLKELEPVRKIHEAAAASEARAKLNKKPEKEWEFRAGDFSFDRSDYGDSDIHGLGGLGIGTMF